MKTYKVLASYRTYVYALVEAENEDQAYEIAHDMDGGDFERDKGDDLSDWSIDDVQEVAP
jgi:uncharacterized membrane protein YkoI